MIQGVIRTINNIDLNKEFIIDNINNRHYSYKDFFSMALSQAEYLEKNVESTDVIAVMENSFDLVLLYFSVMLTTKRLLVVDPKKGSDEILRIIVSIPKTAIIYDKGLLDEYLDHYRIDFFNDSRASYNDIKSVLITKLQRRDARTPYLVTYTSGTSGITKGVEHTLDSLFMTADALAEKVEKRGGTFLHVMPMTYMAGILNSLIYPFLIGARIIINKRFSIASVHNFWDDVIKYDVDLFWLSPSMLMMIDQMDRKSLGEEYCRNHQMTFLIGTAPLTNELRNKFNSRYGVNVYASYGLSETLFISVETMESINKSENNSVGELLSGVEYKLTATNELYLYVPWMYLEYTNDNTSDYFDGKYYKSGDIADIVDGYLYIKGRSKDLIIKGGMNISPVLIENVISKNDAILENVVIGVKDKNGEEKVCCVYQLKETVDNIIDFEAGLKKMIKVELGKNYAIDFLWKVDMIPRNINGKIDKNKLRCGWAEE